MKIPPATDCEINQPIASFDQSIARVDRLRIALLVEATSGGVGRHVIDLAFALHGLGHSVDLLYSTGRIDERFSVGLGELAFKGVKTCEIDMRHGLHMDDLSSIHQVRQYLRKNGPFDILHNHSTKAGFVGRIAALGLGCRALYTPHGLVTNAPFRSRSYRVAAGWLERGLAVLGDAVLCVSEEERQSALERRLPGTKLYVIENGIDLSEAELYREDRPAMRRTLGLDNSDVCVGFVARMIPGKAPRVLLEAFALVQGDLDRPVKLVFVGSGPESSALQRRIDQLQLQEHVLLAGELNGLQAMAAFDIFVLSSMSEAFPYVMLEALSMDLPVISTDVGGATTLVHEGVNGFVVKKSMPGEMAVALRKLVSDPELRRKMGTASREIASQFSLAGMAQRIEQVYRKLLL
jgi:glycosyltransferase involved in cell wall biosynthesis